MVFNRPRLVLTETVRRVQWFRLEDILVWNVCVGTGGHIEIRVPAGFETDLASIPRWLWIFVPKFGPQNYPAVVHDWLYCRESGSCSRFLADALFREAMKQEGVGPFRRWVMFTFVRFMSWPFWKKRGLTRVPSRCGS